ncbi:tetratricopeptide repeat-containing sensor histidine kinase [Sphingobacterium yanglingense]|nr:sensor histidine kinase [Sphingobacterium yanglingense]
MSFSSGVFCQNLDSLEQVLQTGKLTVGDQIKILDDLNWFYNSVDAGRSIHYGKLGLELAQKTGNKKMTGTFLKNIGVSYYMDGVNDTAMIYLEKAKPIAENLNDYRMLAAIYNTYANIYRVQSMYNEAIENYLNAAKTLEAHQDINGLTLIYSNIAGIYQIMANHRQALPYLKKAEQLAIKTKDNEGLGSVYIALSDVGLELGDPKDTSVQYAQKAMKLFGQTGNRLFENKALQTLAKVYYHHHEYNVAVPLARQAVDRAKDLGFARNTAEALTIMSNTLFYQGHYARSAEVAIEVLATDSTDINIIRNIYSNLVLANAYLGHPDLSYKYMDRYREFADRHTTESYQKSLSELQVRYETQKKELKIEALEKQHQLYIWLGIAGALLLLIALAFAYIRYRLAVSRRKLAEKETQRLEQEKQLVAVQATLDGETAERTRLARDLHDGLGSMLSAVKLNLPQVQGNALLESVDVSRFQKAMGMLDDSIQELRRVAHHMMPESLLRFGLKVSLSDFCAAIPLARFHYFGNEARLPEKMEIMIYRCIHELVNNVLKHAEATQINVQLVQEADRVSFTVQDNGKGFKPDSTTEGMGLQNIRSRVEAFQGKMEILSSAQGTEIHIELDLTKLS